jgi:uncharacterized membrane protein
MTELDSICAKSDKIALFILQDLFYSTGPILFYNALFNLLTKTEKLGIQIWVT